MEKRKNGWKSLKKKLIWFHFTMYGYGSIGRFGKGGGIGKPTKPGGWGIPPPPKLFVFEKSMRRASLPKRNEIWRIERKLSFGYGDIYVWF